METVYKYTKEQNEFLDHAFRDGGRDIQRLVNVATVRPSECNYRKVVQELAELTAEDAYSFI